MKKKVRVAFANFWKGFTPESFLAGHPYLLDEFDFLLEEPIDVHFRSVFRHRRPPAPAGSKRVFYTGENRRPPLDEYDFCVSFFRDICDERHLRLPEFIPALYHRGATLEALAVKPPPPPEPRPRFCAFIASNRRCQLRLDFVRALSRYMRVDCAGKCLNNMSTRLPRTGNSKIDFLKSYRFHVAFENSPSLANEGYVTEKLPDAMHAGCLPIYWGDHRVGEDFNEQSFFSVRDHSDFDEVIDRIVQLDRDYDRYCEVMRQPWLEGSRIPDELQVSYFLEFWRRVFFAA